MTGQPARPRPADGLRFVCSNLRRSLCFVAIFNAVFVVSIGCSDDVPRTFPTAPSGTAAAPAPSPAPTAAFPPLTRPGRVFVFAEAALPVAHYTAASRYVLYDEGTFALQYSLQGEYRGRYSESDGRIVFD